MLLGLHDPSKTYGLHNTTGMHGRADQRGTGDLFSLYQVFYVAIEPLGTEQANFLPLALSPLSLLRYETLTPTLTLICPPSLPPSLDPPPPLVIRR